MYSLIILAAGQGKRMQLNYNKVFYKIDEQSILEKSIAAFNDIYQIKQIILVVNEKDYDYIKDMVDPNINVIIGGKERYDSVYKGLQNVNQEYVLIHDAARCFVEKKDIQNLIAATLVHKACFLAVKSKDTIHIIEDDKLTTPIRNNVYIAQTPQAFSTDLIKYAYDKMYSDNNYHNISDDVMVVSTYSNTSVKVVEGSYSNIKITTPEDLF